MGSADITSVTYDRVFRNSAPSGYKGRLCRIVERPVPIKDDDGRLLYNSGSETVGVEFEGGELLRCIRSAVIPADSKMGRQTIAHVARGGRKPSIDTRPTHVRSTPGINVASCGIRAGEGEKPLKFVMSVRLASCPGCVERRGRTIAERRGGTYPGF